MNLTLEKVGGRFVVDDKSLCGSPPVGRGRTMKEAIGDYFHNNQGHLGISFTVADSAQLAEKRRCSRELRKR